MKRNLEDEIRGGAPKRIPGLLGKPASVSFDRRTNSMAMPAKGTHL